MWNIITPVCSSITVTRSMQPRILLRWTAKVYISGHNREPGHVSINLWFQSLHLYLVYAGRTDQFHSHGLLLTIGILAWATVNRTASPLHSSNFFLLISLAISIHLANPLSTTSAFITYGSRNWQYALQLITRTNSEGKMHQLSCAQLLEKGRLERYWPPSWK